MPNQMPAYMGYPSHGFDMAPHVPASFPVHMQTRIASLDTSLLNTPFHPPPTPASSIPSVAKPVPYKWQESAPRQQGELLNVPDAFYVDPEVELLRQGLRTSPLRPRAPIAHMSPTLGDVPMGPGATNQKCEFIDLCRFPFSLGRCLPTPFFIPRFYSSQPLESLC